jgi:uncharacterized protein YukJ
MHSRQRVGKHTPLASYGILKGELFTPQEQTYQGNWFHGIFYLTVPNASVPRRCVTDFSSATKDLIQYKIYDNLQNDLFSSILALPDGYTPLAATDDSGALDYVRSPIFGASPTEGWVLSDGEVAVQALQQSLSSAPMRLYVFGETFTDETAVTQDGVQSKDGMHNVHMNQGDPAGSSDGIDHQADDGIWQDGATVFENADGTLTAFCSKFVPQTFATNDQGLPD